MLNNFNPWVREILDFIISIFIALIIVIPFRFFVAEPYIVQGASMSPNYTTGDYIIVNKFAGYVTSPERGDVLVFIPPSERKDSWKNFFPIIDKRVKYIKRVIGLPGETLKIKDKKVFIKKEGSDEFLELRDDFVKNDNLTIDQEVVLKEKEYFMLGDNRGNSYDSEEWGPILYSDIVGEPVLRLLPFDNFELKPANEKFNF